MAWKHCNRDAYFCTGSSGTLTYFSIFNKQMREISATSPPVAVLVVALMLGGFVAPIFAFLFGALVLDLTRRPMRVRKPVAVRYRRPF